MTDAPNMMPDGRPNAEGGLLVDRLGFGYDTDRVLESVTFSVATGSIAALVGPSGAGKTTLVHLVAGLLTPEIGTIAHPFRRPAVVFQDALLLPWRTARGNVAFALTGCERDRRRRWIRAGDALSRAGLEAGDAMKYPHALSGGMKKRVAFARALAVDPDLMLLDEPFSALDSGLAARLERLLLSLVAERRMTALLVTHDLPSAIRIADRVVVLAGHPATVAAIHDIDRPAGDRDPRFVFAELDRLLARPDVAAAFAGGD